MDKNVHGHKNWELGAQTYVWSHFKEDHGRLLLKLKKSLKSETKLKLYRFKFMKMIYEQYFIFYFMNILYMKHVEL